MAANRRSKKMRGSSRLSLNPPPILVPLLSLYSSLGQSRRPFKPLSRFLAPFFPNSTETPLRNWARGNWIITNDAITILHKVLELTTTEKCFKIAFRDGNPARTLSLDRDIQAYVSWAFLYFAPGSNRVLILVDNRPWMMNNYSKSARIWQLMVTKYRMSPFTNTRALNRSSNKNGMNDGQEEYHAKAKKINWWFPVIDSTKWQPKCLMDLSKALHGFLVFEVAWKDVHGINYLNELQTDTSLALDVKSMKKWEFYSPVQASKCLSSWFSCNKSEIQSLRKSLRLLSDLNLHQPSAHSSSVLFQRPSPSDDDFLDVQESFTETGDEGEIQHEKICSCDEGSVIAPSQYSNTLILFRFSDCILPLKFKEIIMSDMRLLILLETGLPSWVIFFQSYPFFCHFYRTWMRHLARTLYILISLVTVIFGFYDLYKNVPLLKATVARLSGPLFNWIEGWDMVTRLRYLGTMLFLQNIEKALKWFLMMSRSIATLLSAIIRPFSGPLGELMEFIFPLWSACVEVAEMFFSTIWFTLASMCNVLLDIAEFVLWPFEFCCSYLWSIVTLLYPLISIIWDFVLLPIRCVLTLADYMAVLLSNIFELFKDVWESIRGIFQTTDMFKTAALLGAKKGAYDISIWQGLWRDLFSQVFRGARSVINGMATFFLACNRHRLSTYNHVQAFLQRVANLAHINPHACLFQRAHQLAHQNEEERRECDRCK